MNEMASANNLGQFFGGGFSLKINNLKSPGVFPGAASPLLSSEEYRSPECALMSVEFLEWTSPDTKLGLKTL